MTDAVGRRHVRARENARIVCLVPSITELVCELGLASRLVGRTGFCIHPREVVGQVPKCGGTKAVKLDRIRELAPSHVILNVDENLRETAEALAEFVPHLIVTHPQDPRDNLDLYRLLGFLFDREERAEQLCQDFERAYAASVPPDPPARNVLYLIWRDPWMTVSRETYVSRTLALFGPRTLPARSADRYPSVALSHYAGTVEEVLLSSEPYPFRERHIAEVAAALPQARVRLIDGEMTSWYGTRAIQGLHYLAGFVGDDTAAHRV